MASKNNSGYGCGSWIIGLFLVVVIADENARTAVLGFGSAAALIALAVYLIRKHLQDKKRQRQLKQYHSIVDRHTKQLRIRRSQLTVVNIYGYIEDQKWDKEVAHFLQTVFGISPRSHPKLYSTLSNYINNITEDYSVQHAGNISPKAGHTFEYQVKDILESHGWLAAVTRGSGDQGIDIIATKSGRKLVIQCKNWKNSVGNKAVQEIHAGKTHENADFAAVVATSHYTPSAYELANSTGVILLHPDELDKLDDRLA